MAKFDDSRRNKYLSEIYRHARVAQVAIDSLHESFAAEPFEINIDRVFMGVQSFLASSGMISKMVWPAVGMVKDPNVREWTVKRKQILQEVLQLDDTSPLASRNLRNAFEHYDERLDTFVSKSYNTFMLDWTITSGPSVFEVLGDAEDMPLVTCIDPKTLNVRIMTASMSLLELNEEVQRIGQLAKDIIERR
ncbi:hypothetical protein QM806_04395 [Rhodococcus sp. IEGM 1351]|uniref:hypothetical protein n=1 Tax=Rhodococcus sp. IEGM 1351 TaxID=3047089 RepID=UPI0024B86C0F|nr:hypothetical protein [Rhodococcus sp. IEGM 1351]MDI9934694.1 hypothetical protein [Rhodococcus sp. IEGM 1351]